MVEEEKHEIIKIGIRSIAASFPGVASLATAWSEWDSKKRWAYIKEFFDDIKQLFEEYDERIQKQQDYLKSEEAPHLLSLVLEKVQREHREDKRKRFAKFYLESLAAGNQVTFDEKRYFLELLDELNDTDFRILRVIHLNGKLKVENIKDIDLDILVVCLSKLSSRGLIAETSPAPGGDLTSWMGDIRSWNNAWRGKWFEILPIGRKFLEFLT